MEWTIPLAIPALVVLVWSCVSWDDPAPPTGICYPPRWVRQCMFLLGAVMGLAAVSGTVWAVAT